jgi:hypothetical protein
LSKAFTSQTSKESLLRKSTCSTRLSMISLLLICLPKDSSSSSKARPSDLISDKDVSGRSRFSSSLKTSRKRSHQHQRLKTRLARAKLPLRLRSKEQTSCSRRNLRPLERWT